jgi:hypothetical protein
MTEGKALMTYSANEWGDQSDTRLRASDSLAEAKEKGEVAVNALVAFKLAGSLDTFPGRCDFNEYAFFLDSERFVKRNEVSGLGLGGLFVKGETGIDLGGDTAGNDLEDLFSEFDKLQWPVSEGETEGCASRTHQAICRGVDLFVDGATFLSTIRDCDINQTSVCGFVRRSEQQRWICRRILP